MQNLIYYLKNLLYLILVYLELFLGSEVWGKSVFVYKNILLLISNNVGVVINLWEKFRRKYVNVSEDLPVCN